MPYVTRNAAGFISAIFLNAKPSARELIAADHPDVLVFLGQENPKIGVGKNGVDKSLDKLTLSDIAFIRVLEDVIDLLIEKKLLAFTDLPEKAREKILSRKDVRGRLAGSNDLVVPEDRLL